MADKRNKRTGIARPSIEGVEGLFGDPEPTVSERVEDDTDSPPKARPEDESEKNNRVKTSFYLSQEAHELLHDLRYFARKNENRPVSLGELMDRAIFDLAKKMNVTNKN